MKPVPQTPALYIERVTTPTRGTRLSVAADALGVTWDTYFGGEGDVLFVLFRPDNVPLAEAILRLGRDWPTLADELTNGDD
jgi:hypothetical protein